jgi:predicted ribosomally synthesized peptide with nif11-like leader
VLRQSQDDILTDEYREVQTMENVKKFYDALASDEAMKKRAEDINEKQAAAMPDEDVVKAEIIAFAKAEGYAFTAEELEAYANQAKPLDDDDLEAVAGGHGRRPNIKHKDGSNCWFPEGCNCTAVGGGGNLPGGCACIFGGGGPAKECGGYLVCVAYGWIQH